MAEFSKLVITNKGKSLIAKALANMAVIEFTKISSSGTVYEVSELESLESITDIRQTSLVSSVSVTNDTSVEVQTSFTNTEVTEGYYLRALGLYANDPDDGEILYGVTAETSGNCYMPAYNGVTSSGIYLQFVTTVGNAENVSLAINPAATATIKDIKDLEERIKIIDFDDSGEVEGIESFTDFMSSFIKGTSIYQLLTNFKAGLKYVLHTGKLVNSGMCQTPGQFALDAAYGYTLTEQITGLYSDIQMLRNDLSALDTRVTNAITGGDLVPPYTLDLSVLSYKDEIHGQNSSVTQSRMAVAADSQNGTGYVIRRFSTTFTVPKKGKIKINLSRYNKDSYTTGIPITVHVYALDPSSSHESNNLLSKSIKIDGEDSLDLSSLAGRNIKVTLGMTRSGGTIYNTCGITINSLIVTNQ